MRPEHLYQWFHEAKRDDTTDTTNWQKVVSIVQSEIRDGMLSEESTWQIVVLIPKGARKYFRGIGLVKVLWKAVTSLLNQRLTEAIKFHEVMHGF